MTGPLASRRDLAQGVLAALQARAPALTATIVARDSGLPCLLGAKLLVVDGQPRAGSLGWDWLEGRVLSDAPAILEAGRSRVVAYVREPDGDSPAGRVEVFYELFLPPEELVILGAGHIAMPLAQIGKLLDFEVTVVDDRPAYANQQRFPTADRIIVGDFEQVLAEYPIRRRTYLVLVTRAHTHDVACLRHVIHSPAAYIGMIGSKRRVFAVLKLLHAEGVPIEQLLRVHAPIGLDIKTETPAEIAVSIGAELVKVRRGGEARSFSDLVRDRYARALARGEPEPV